SYPRRSPRPYPPRMHDGDHQPSPRFSDNALHVMGLIMRRGGTMRVGPLLAVCRLGNDALGSAVNELVERSCLQIVWRGPRPRRPSSIPPRFRKAERVVTTRYGRWRSPNTWQF